MNRSSFSATRLGGPASGGDAAQGERVGGATLIEMVVVIGLVGVLASAVFLPLVTGVKLWNRIQSRQDALVQARLGMERLVREIEWVRDDQSVTIADITRFWFYSARAGNPFVFLQFSGGNITVNGNVLIGGVSGFLFTYHIHPGTLIGIPTVSSGGVTRNTNIWRVRIQFTATSGGQAVTLEEIVTPRSFLRSNK